jgi:glucan phosphoethanolaminetransferase (alkaline phosphatase superfamily)
MESEYKSFEPIIKEETITNQGNLILATFLGIIAIISLITIIQIFKLNLIDSLKATIMVTMAFVIITFILIKPSIIRKIHTKEIEIITQPIIQPIEKYIPVIQEVIKEIEKPITRIKEIPIMNEIVKHVFIEKNKKKLNIPKYKYRGSTETMTYHKTSCRFSKLIKNKYKISRNDLKDFKKYNFKPCKICKPNKV